MNMRLLTLGFMLLSAPSWAGSSLSTVSISQTLTLTSPSAYISMTGISSTAFFRTVSSSLVSSTNVSTTNISVRGIDSTKTIPCGAFVYDGVAQSTLASTSLISSIARRATGIYDISGSFPTVPHAMCSTENNSAANCASFNNVAGSGPSPTTAGLLVSTFQCSTGSANNAVIQCFLYCQ